MNYVAEPYRVRAGVLALLVHALFFSLLYFGFSWQNEQIKSVSVELWESLPEPAAPPPPPPVGMPRPVQPVVEEAPPPPPPVVKPDIALPEQKKPVVPVPKKPVEVKPPPKPVEAVKPKVDFSSIREANARAVAEEQRTAMREAFNKERQSKETEQRAAAEKQAAAQRQLAKEKAELSAQGKVVNEYIAKIQSKIRHNIVHPNIDKVDKRVLAIYKVTVLPDGSVSSARLVKTSGDMTYDQAVEKAIYKSEPLPLPSDPALSKEFRELRLEFRPTDR